MGRGSRFARLAVAMTLATALLGGCAGAAPSPEAPVATATVDLPASYRFVPAAIRVAPGATVTWTNHDHFTHNVTFLDGGLPSEPLQLKPDASATFTFPNAGTFRYQCSLHPQDMQGSVLVTGS
jgi:plastocyanin